MNTLENIIELIQKWIQKFTGFTPVEQFKIYISCLIILTLWLSQRLLFRLIWRKTKDPHSQYIWQKGTRYFFVMLGILLISRLWLEGIQSLATYLGILSAGVAIALKDLVSSFAGWLFILWRRPFFVGDRIQIGKHRGDVIDVRIFTFTLMEVGNWVHAEQSTGRIIFVPNLMIFREVVANYSKGFQFIWNEIPVYVTFESDWEKAKEILNRIVSQHCEHLSQIAGETVKEASKKFMIFYKTLTPYVYTSVREYGVMLTIRYLCEPRRRRGTEQCIWEEILREFATHQDIDFAYPTQRFYNHMMEGKRNIKI
jgi:small-conductance mechanosensitive channel